MKQPVEKHDFVLESGVHQFVKDIVPPDLPATDQVSAVVLRPDYPCGLVVIATGELREDAPEPRLPVPDGTLSTNHLPQANPATDFHFLSVAPEAQSGERDSESVVGLRVVESDVLSNDGRL